MNNENKKRYISGYHQEKDITKIDKKEITAVNLFIIREMFKLISDSQVQLKHFYSFLFTQGRTFSLTDRLNICEKFEVSLDDFYLDLQKDENVDTIDKSQQEKYAFQFEAYIKNNVGNINSAINTLINYGLSPEFFDGEKIDISEQVWTACKEYLDEDYTKDTMKNFDSITDKKEKKAAQNKNYDFAASAQKRKKIQQDLLKELYRIFNMDGSLIIESIRDIIMDMTHTNISENYNDTDIALLQQIDSHQMIQGKSYSQNSLTKLYLQMSKHIDAKDFSFDVKTTDLSRITKTTDNESVCQNLFIIIKTYQMFAKIEGIQDADEKLKNYLNLKDSDYTDLENGDTVLINSRDIAEKLSIYRFPATLFRADHPTRINLSANIQDALDTFNIDYDIVLFEFRLQFWLTYCIDTQNIVLVLAVYSLFNSLNSK